MADRTRTRQLPVLPGQMNPNANGTTVPQVGPVPFQSSQPQMANPNRRVIPPGATTPPADSIPVDRLEQAAIANGATGNIITVQIPNGFSFRVNGIGFSATDASALSFLSWSVIVNPPGIPVDPYINKPAGIGSIAYPSYVFLLRYASEQVVLQISNTAGVLVTFTYFARLTGWFFKELEAPR